MVARAQHLSKKAHSQALEAIRCVPSGMLSLARVDLPSSFRHIPLLLEEKGLLLFILFCRKVSRARDSNLIPAISASLVN